MRSQQKPGLALPFHFAFSTALGVLMDMLPVASTNRGESIPAHEISCEKIVRYILLRMRNRKV
jgi:hypothetical protein